MTRLLTTVALALSVAACASRTPPPQPEGTYLPINGQEQAGMPMPPKPRKTCDVVKPFICKDS